MRVSRFYIKYLFLLIPFLLSVVVFTQTNNDFANVLLFFKLIVFICITVEHVRNAYITKFDCKTRFVKGFLCKSYIILKTKTVCIQ